MEKNSKRVARIRRHGRVRKKISGTPERPRMAVFRSARHIYAQVIDDSNAATIVSASSLSKDLRDKCAKGNKKDAAKLVGQELGKKAIEKGIGQVLFDRGGYKFHGRVKAIADSAREAGLKF